MILIVSNKGYDNFTLDHQVIGVTCDAYTNYVRLTCNNRRKDQCGERIKRWFAKVLFSRGCAISWWGAAGVASIGIWC